MCEIEGEEKEKRRGKRKENEGKQTSIMLLAKKEGEDACLFLYCFCYVVYSVTAVIARTFLRVFMIHLPRLLSLIRRALVPPDELFSVK